MFKDTKGIRRVNQRIDKTMTKKNKEQTKYKQWFTTQ